MSPPRRPSIWFVVQTFPEEPGGIRSLVSGFADCLAEDHDLAVVVLVDSPRLAVPSDGSAPDGGAGWSVVRARPRRAVRALLAPASVLRWPVVRRSAYSSAGLPVVRWYGRTAARSLAGVLVGAGLRPPDVVHTFTADVTGHIAQALAEHFGASLVCSAAIHPGQYGNGPIDAALYRSCDAVVAVSAPEAEVYRSLGVAAERVTVVPAPSRDLGTDGRAAARQRLGLHGPWVLFAGARRPYKGADLAAAGASWAAERIGRLGVAFVGPGPHPQVVDPPPDLTVTIEGAVPDDELGDWIRAADVVVLPSLHESCSITVLEAFGAGVPVVVSDIPTLEHQVGVSGGGLAVRRDAAAIGEALVALLTDPARATAMGEAGRRHWDLECTPSVRADRLRGLYGRLVPSGP